VVRAVSPRTPVAGRARRRRRRAPESDQTVASSQPGTDTRRRSATSRRSNIIATALILVALVVVGLGATATWLAVQNEDGTLPRVSDIRAEADGSEVTFLWDDPGLAVGDSYHVRVDDGTPAIQRSSEFAVVTEPGQRVCIVVRVAREGRIGPASAERCIQTDGA